MKYGLVFLLLGLVCGYSVWTLQSIWGRVFLASVAVCFIGVGLAFISKNSGVFLKRPDGRLSLLSYVLYWPYFLLNWLSLMAIGRSGKENAMDEIVHNLYLGRRLTTIDRDSRARHQFAAVLDLTSEFSRCSHLLATNHYKCIPLLDTFAPTREQLIEGVDFIQRHIEAGPVYVHCAMGHGRSATFIAAYLITAGLARDAETAQSMIREQRPGVGLTTPQMKALKTFTGAYLNDG